MADKNGSRRVWATIVYPESAPVNWINFLRDLHAPILISPLHNKDEFPDGNLKKPHYHVMMILEGKMTKSEWDVIRSAIGGVGDEKIISTRGYARYLCHLDEDQERHEGCEYKPKYNRDFLIELGGVNYQQYLDKSMAKYSAIKEMIEYARDEKVRSVRQIMDYAAVNRPDWWGHLCDGGLYVLREYLR